MRGMPFSLQEEGGLEVLLRGEEEKSLFWGSGVGCGNNKRRKGLPEGLEPRSVLDNRRSPSPPTSTSTLSSSLGGGGASSDTAGVAAVSDKPGAHKWPATAASVSTANPSVEEGRKEEWAAELPPIPAASLEGGGVGLGAVEDWEVMLSEPVASPGQEQTFLRWIMGDIDDPSGLKHHQIPLPALDGGGTAGGAFGFVDPGFRLDPIGSLCGGGAAASICASNPSPLASSVTSAGLFGPTSSSSSSSVVKAPTFGVANPPNSTVFPPAPANSLPVPFSMPTGVFYQEPVEEKPPLLSPSFLLSQYQQSQAPQNPAFFLPLPQFDSHPPAHLLPPQPKRHHPLSIDQMAPKPPFSDSAGPDFLLRRGQPQPQAFPPLNVAPFHLQQCAKVASGGEAAAAAAAQQQQALVEQLFKVVELVEAGNTISARGILARLNHQLPSPMGKPLLRSAFYFKEALHLLTSTDVPHPLPPPSPLATPFDVVLKLGTVKAFSDVSPVLQFTNFTSIQALLEELGPAPRIHVVDFDIGVGGQWSAFMQELAQRRCTAAGASSPSLKITAFASRWTHHPLELHLTHENLSHFATDLNIPFEFNLLRLDPFDPSPLLSLSSGNEAIAVNLPIGSAVLPPAPTLLRLLKQLSPKIVISVDHGYDHSDLSFARHFAHAFQSCTVLLDSIDAAGADPEVANRIERFLVQPKIENAVLGHHRTADKMLSWRTLFNSAGFVPVQFSNFTETQAECLLKRVQVRGFHVEKRQASLCLCWQRGELVSVSAWRC